MRIGISSAQTGRLADPAAVQAAAVAAEQVGYASLWVIDRLPVALQPRSGYAGLEGEAFPDDQARALDPFVVLAVVAAVTKRVRVGTNVLVAPWYRPALLARALTSLDVLSDGRLTVGLGTGWSVDEYEAAGADMSRRGRHLDEILDVLDAHWSDGPIRHNGELARIGPARNLLQPVQRPRPPLLLAGQTPAALDRIARRADGWITGCAALDLLGSRWRGIREAAAGYGREPEALELVVRAEIDLLDQPLDGDRRAFHGSIDQVAADLEVVRGLGAHEVVLAVGGDPCLDDALDACARIAEEMGLTSLGDCC